MLPNGKVCPIDSVDIGKEVANIDSYFNEDMKYTDDPVLGWIREDYIAKQTSYLVNRVDYDKLAEKIRKNREEHAKVVRTELDLIEKMTNQSSLKLLMTEILSLRV